MDCGSPGEIYRTRCGVASKPRIQTYIRRQGNIFPSDSPDNAFVSTVFCPSTKICIRKTRWIGSIFNDWTSVYESGTLSGLGTDPCAKFCTWDRAQSLNISKSSPCNWSVKIANITRWWEGYFCTPTQNLTSPDGCSM